MVNKDILQALELLTHKGFIESSSNDFIARRTKIANINRINNKKVLLIDETGDIIAELFKGKPKEIYYYLENIFAKYYIELKYNFVLRNNYKDFIDFFVMSKNNNKLFSYNKYYEISKFLTESTRLFWDALYENINYDGMKLRTSDLFEQKYHIPEKYTSEKNYNIIRKNMIDVKIYNISNIEDIYYDFILISNGLKEKYCDIIIPGKAKIIYNKF